MRSIRPKYSMSPKPRLAVCVIMASLLGLLAACSTPTPAPTATPMACTPVGGAIEPSVCVAGVSVQVNDGTPRPVAYDEQMALKAGDTLRPVSLRYCASSEAPADKVSGEAYLFKNGVEDYTNGLFIRFGSPISAGCGLVGDFEGSWKVESGQHRVVIALVHYFRDDSEVDDHFYFNLNVGP